MWWAADPSSPLDVGDWHVVADESMGKRRKAWIRPPDDASSRALLSAILEGLQVDELRDRWANRTGARVSEARITVMLDLVEINRRRVLDDSP